MSTTKNFFQRVSEAQIKLKAPKNQRNSFGNYNYRSCEDILEAVKPILNEAGLVLNLSDEVVFVGERYYVKATATIFDTESDNLLVSTAYAREADTKKGMDDSQITGTASSYARKYALNGLMNIDDTKDADTDEHENTKRNYEKKAAEKKAETPKPAEKTAETKSAIPKCENPECGNRIFPIKKSNGETMSVSDVVEYSKEHYGGKIYCESCMKAKSKAKGEANK